MAQPTPRLSADNPETRTPIGELHILVYDWKPGQSEVQVRFPVDALPGAPNAATLQGRFAKLISDELSQALRAFGSPPRR